MMTLMQRPKLLFSGDPDHSNELDRYRPKSNEGALRWTVCFQASAQHFATATPGSFADWQLSKQIDQDQTLYRQASQRPTQHGSAVAFEQAGLSRVTTVLERMAVALTHGAYVRA